MDNDLNELLIDAINAQRLRPALAELADDSARFSTEQQTRLASAKSAIDGLDQVVDDEISRLSKLLSDSDVRKRGDIAVSSIRPTAPDRAIYAISLSVPWESLEPTARVLEAAGYRAELRDNPELWRRHTQFVDNSTFLSDDSREFRVQLHWEHPDGLLAKIPARLRPTVDDLTAVSLPASLAALYAVVKPVRQLLGKRQPSATDLGPFLGTPDGLIPHLLEFSGIERGQQLIDLGCGDGRVLIEAVERYGCDAIGYETDTALVDAARAAAQRSSDPAVVDKVQLFSRDAREADVSQADVVFLFLPIPALKTLVPDLLDRMKPGAVLLAHEQEQLETSRPPEERRALIEPGGVTVAHKWRAG